MVAKITHSPRNQGVQVIRCEDSVMVQVGTSRVEDLRRRAQDQTIWAEARTRGSLQTERARLTQSEHNLLDQAPIQSDVVKAEELQVHPAPLR